MISAEKSIERVLAAEPKNGEKYAFITNEQLLGVRPSNPLEEAGVDACAVTRRDEINGTLESEHGVALVPFDYRGTWRIVNVDQRGAHLVYIRLRRLQKLIGTQKNGVASMLQLTIEEYETNPHTTDEFCKVLKRAHRLANALALIADETIQNHLDKLEALMLPYKNPDEE
jgi:hypothetical protein